VQILDNTVEFLKEKNEKFQLTEEFDYYTCIIIELIFQEFNEINIKEIFNKIIDIFVLYSKYSQSESNPEKNQVDTRRLAKEIKKILLKNDIGVELGINLLKLLIEQFIFLKEDHGSSSFLKSSRDEAYIIISGLLDSNHIEYNQILIQVK